MFRAVREFDGSDSEKCITLNCGDSLTAVHVVDEAWYIGHNERTGETGAFPTECVTPEDGSDTHSPDPRWVRGQRSGSVSEVDDRITRVIDETLDRGRSLSSSAINFDVNRLRATRPQKTFHLKPMSTLNDDVKENLGNTKDVTVDISSVFSNPSYTHETDLSTAHNVASSIAFDVPQSTSEYSVLPTAKSTGGEEIHDTTLLHSLSVTESVTDWYESSFEESFQQELEQSDHALPAKSESECDADEGNHEDKTGKEHPSVTEISTNMNTLLCVSSALSALLFIGVAFLALVFVYQIPTIAACVIATVAVLCMVILFVSMATFKCVISLLFPSSVSAVGQAVLYAMIVCLILNGPILNISRNLKQTGSNMACAVDLLTHQQAALQRKSNGLASGIMKHIGQQRERLMDINANISSDFGTLELTLSAVDDHLEELISSMTTIYQSCWRPLEDAQKRCLDTYCSLFIDEYLKHQCEAECKKIEAMRVLCKDLNIGGNIAEASTKSKIILERAKDNMKIDISVMNDSTVSDNATSSVKVAVDDAIDHSISSFEHFIKTAILCMSLSLLLLLVWSFKVYKCYLSNDDYNNTYITKRLRQFDSNAKETGGNPVLPLKNYEQGAYLDIKSLALSQQQRNCFINDIKHMVLQFLIFSMIILLDYTLFDVLCSIQHIIYRGYVPVHSRNFQIKVNGVGPVAYFYESLLKSIDLYDDFMKRIITTSEQCNQTPTNPVDAYNITGLVTLYVALICVISLRGYAPRLQSLIFALHNSTQEQERTKYLCARIHVERSHHASFFPQTVMSRHKETIKKRDFSLWMLLRNRIPSLQKYLKYDVTPRCIGCGGKDQDISAMSLCYCTSDKSIGEILYCDECKGELKDKCPICNTTAG